MTGHKIPFSFRTIPHQRRGSVDNLGMFAKRQSTSECNLYTNPTAGAVIKAEDTLKISWDTNCYTPVGNSIRITLHTAKEGQMRKGWSEVNWGLGSFETKFDPAWIGSQANVPIFLAINDNNAPSWMPLIEQGPTFNVTYDAVAAVSAGIAAGSSTSLPSSETYTPWESVNNFFKQGMNKGQIAAAVIMPILAVGAFLAVYILWSRRKEAEKRKEWKEKMDQRMSTISVDWRSMSAAGGHAAVRQSMAISMAERRASSFYGQPNSSFHDVATPRPRMNSEAASSAHRVSRVSFAADNRPSLAMDRIPAVPRLPAAYQQTGRKSVLERDTIYDNSPPNGSLSPIQQAGAFVLDDDSIRDRLSAASANKDHARPSMDEDLNRDLSYEPAIAMMRDQAPRLADPVPTSPITPLAPALTREPANGTFRTYSIGAYSGTSASDSFFDTVTPTAPSTLAATSDTTAPESPVDPDEALRAYAARAANSNQPQSTASPFSGFANGPGLAAATGLDMSSPDAMFRAYAASRPSAPQPAQVNTTGNTMRQLYGNGGMTQGLVGAGRSRGDTITGDRNPYRDSMADGGVGRAN